MERIAQASPRFKARMAGGLWLMVIATGTFAFLAGATLIVRNDAVATATNILAAERFYRLGFVADLIAGACYMGVTVLLYDLLKPVSRSVSLLAAFFGLGGIAIGAATSLVRLAPLVLLRSDQYLSTFTPNQLQTMALAALRLYEQAFLIAMVVFGLQCVLVGCLIVRSTFLPRILGVLLALGGLSYVISSLANFLAPAFGARLAPFIVPAAILGEGSLTLWLLLVGVNAQRWNEQASAATIRT